jgi:hypothetical protein
MQIRRGLDSIASIAVLYRRPFSTDGPRRAKARHFFTHHFAFLVLPFDERIMNERVEDAHQRILVIPEQLHRHLTRDAKDAFDAGHAQSVDQVLRQTKRNAFGDFQRFALVCVRKVV